MTIGIISGILFFAIALSMAIAAHYFLNGKVLKAGKNKTSGNKKPVCGGICAGLAVIFAVLFAFIPFSFHTVNAGEIAVVKHLGNAVNVRQPGTYFGFWVTEEYEIYDSKVQNLQLRDTAYSADSQKMDATISVQFRIDTSKAIDIANKYGSLEALTNKIQSVALDKSKVVLSSKSAMEIIEKRDTVSPTIEAAIKEAIGDGYFINVTKISLTNIDFSDAFEKTVEDKMMAEQEKLKAEYEKQTAIINAQKELEVAKLQAEARIATAKAEAESTILIAQAEAQSIKAKSIEIARALGFEILEKEIADEETVSIEYTINFEGKSAEEIAVIADYLKYIEYISKWNGELPGVLVTDGSAQVIIPAS